MSTNIGLSEALRKKSVEALSRVLSESYKLYFITQHYHWNVTGFNFYTLHELFGRQYKELSQAIDEMAERVRALGLNVVIKGSSFEQLKEMENMENLKAEDMIQNLLSVREKLIQTIRSVLEGIKEDEVTSDFLINRLRTHESAVWGLRSLLE